MSAAVTLLDRLNGVRETGDGRWIAQCPAHDDKHPSLSVRLFDDNSLSVKCFAGCSSADVVRTVGLELRDLFPPTDRHHRAPHRRPWNPMDVLRCLAHEALVVVIAADDLAQGRILDEVDRERLDIAASRLSQALRLLEGKP